MTPAAADLLSLLAQRPIPVGRCDRRSKKELIRLRYAEPITSEIQTMDRDTNGNLVPSDTRVGVMLCITDLGKAHL